MEREINYYRQNPDLREYYDGLPWHIQLALDRSGAEISTLGELKKVAEHLKNLLPPDGTP